jgi:hypothetical protein
VQTHALPAEEKLRRGDEALLMTIERSPTRRSVQARRSNGASSVPNTANVTLNFRFRVFQCSIPISTAELLSLLICRPWKTLAKPCLASYVSFVIQKTGCAFVPLCVILISTDALRLYYDYLSCCGILFLL